MQIQIPIQLQKAMWELPPIPPFNESLPIPPPPSPERMNPVQLAISLTLFMILVGYVYIELQPIPELRVNAPFLSILFEGSVIRIINTLIPIFKAILIPVGLFLILGLMFIQQKTYQSQLLNHSVLTESYFELLESYSLRQSEQSSDRHHSKFR